jgi:hypothetical protein
VFISFEVIANGARVFDAAVSGAFFGFAKSQEVAFGLLRKSLELTATIDDAIGLDSLSKKFEGFAKTVAEAESFSGALSEQAALRVQNAANNIKSFAEIFAEADAIVAGAQARAEEAAQKQKDLSAGLTGESRIESLTVEFESEMLLREQQADFLRQFELDQKAATNAGLEALELQHLEQEAQERLRITQQTEQAIFKVKQDFQNAAIGLLQALSTKSKAAALVLIAITKGRAIAEAIINTEAAATKALGDGDSYTAAARAAAIRALGYASVGIIAATGFVEAGNVLSSSAPGAPLGSPQNPVFTRGNSEDSANARAGATQKPIANLTLVGIGEKGLRDLASELSKVLSDYDVRIQRED